MKKLVFLLIPLIFLALAFRSTESYIVQGTVTDEQGTALAGISVVEKAGSASTLTDRNGAFTINLSSGKATLIFSGVGFKNQELRVKEMLTLTVRMKAASTKLEEVVVTGYGQQKKFDLAGAANVSTNRQAAYLSGKLSGVVKDQNHYPAPATGNHNADRGKARDSEFNTEDYDRIVENRFLSATDNPLSTFSIDVDAASYSNIRRYIKSGVLPPSGAVRIEEMINYFHYDYAQPKNEDPFSINTELSTCPWNSKHQLLMIGLQGGKIPMADIPASNLVFLLDVSGSMQSENKLPLVKSSMKLLVDQLREEDHVSIVVYAGAAGLVLPPTSGANKMLIKDAIDRLEAGGSTAGGAGIKLAYQTARLNFSEEGNNRVILCTDGDFNVGESSDDAMERLIEKERETGIFLTVLGYGMGNYKDNKIQKLADKGNGNHAYIDTEAEAKKVLVSEFGGTLFTIAKDVKLQLEFNPQYVKGYRLIGYENRMLAREDFNDDKKDAGDLGSGHTVTALYELIPPGSDEDDLLKKVDDLKYQPSSKAVGQANNELLTVKLRYKSPNAGTSKLLSQVVLSKPTAWAAVSNNFRFAASVAEFGLLLRNSEYRSGASYKSVIELAKAGMGRDVEGYRKEFIGLVRSVEGLVLEDVSSR